MSVLSQVQGLPGMRLPKTSLHRMVTRGGWLPSILPTGKVLAGGASRDPGNDPVTRIRAGMILGMIASPVNSLGAAGQYAPSILGVTTNAEAVGSTSIQASAAVVTELIRRIGTSGDFYLLGPGTAGGPVTKELVTYSAASSVNITCTAIANNFVAGSLILPTDGSEEPLTFLANGNPILAVDFDGANIAQELPQVPIDCIIDSEMLLPVWPSDTAIQEWIVSRLTRAGGGRFIFSHLFNG